MRKISNFIVNQRKWIIIFYVLLMVVCAIGISKVHINYDMSKYLPNDSKIREGMEVMSDEFGDLSSITVMIDDISTSEAEDIKEDMATIENVKSVVYLSDDENYQKDGHSKFMVTVAAGTYSSEASDVLEEIKDRYSDYEPSVSGAIVDNKLMVSTLTSELPMIAVIVCVIIFIILFLLCDSWVEPFLFMGCIGVAIVINMGSNALLSSVSFMTFTVSALLQMGLSMDYSIMLMNRYSQEKREDKDSVRAMKKALTNSFAAISGSSVTTIVGLLALVFMSFKIGQDMGVVLAKGVFISLICIFTLLPGLIVAFDKAIAKTHKKSLNLRVGTLMKEIVKVRWGLIPLVVIVVIAAVIIKSNLSISYIKMFDNEEQAAIEAVFGVDNQMVLLYENSEEDDTLKEYISWLEEQPEINSVSDYSNTIGMEFTYQELADEMDMDVEQAKLLYQMYADYQSEESFEKITLYELLQFVNDEVLNNDTFADYMTEEEAEQIADTFEQLEAGKTQMDEALTQLEAGKQQLEQYGMDTQEMDAQIASLQENQAYVMCYVELSDEELANLLGEDVSEIDALLQLKRMMNLDVETEKIGMEDMLDFIVDEVMISEVYSTAITEEMAEQVEDGKKEIEDSKAMMVASDYNRMSISAAVDLEGEDTFEFVGRIQKKADEMFANDVYLIGDSAMGYEMNEGFQDELDFVTILTVVAILIVVIITFKSATGAVMLVVVIQSAVFITTAIVNLMGVSVNYIALILVQCILMGATIDYGILFLSNYREMRKELEKKEAICEAMNHSIKTILTSSLILVSCCLTVGFIMTQEIIAQTCSIIAYGTICAVVMVIFVLPALMYILDRFIVKKEQK